jgi:Tfp pilus assembly protein PilP
MKRHSFTTLILVTAILILSACGGGEAEQKAAVDVKAAAPSPAPVAPAAKAPAAGTQVAEAEDEPPPPLTVPRGFQYTPRGRRDPFVNPAPRQATAEEVKPTIRPDGLPGVLVSEVKVSGIIYSSEPTMKKAMLAAGRKTYFAAQGDSLFDGVIKEIRPNEVVFTMVSTATKQPVNKETVLPTGGSPVTSAGEKR